MKKIFKTPIKRAIATILICICGVLYLSAPKVAFAASCGGCHPSCKYESVSSCTLCPLFVVVFNTVSKVGAVSVSKFSGAVMQVVVVAFAVWLALEVIKFVASMKTKDTKDFVQSLINQGFAVLIVLIILKSGVGNFYNIFIQPVYNTGQIIAQAVLKDDTTVTTTQRDKDKRAQKDKSISQIKEIPDGLPSSMGVSIVTTMTMMENRIRQISALGSALMCQSWEEAYLVIIPKFKYLIFGFAIYVLAVSMMVVIPFLMIDAVLQLGVATALMPFAVGSYAFKWSRKYCKKVFDTFLNSALLFLFLSIIILLILSAIQTSVDTSTSTTSNFQDMFAKGSATGSQAYAEFLSKVNWGSGAFLNLFFTFLLAWSVMDMAQSFANKFADSLSSTKIGRALGGTAGSLTKGAVTKGVAPAVAGTTGVMAYKAVKRAGRAVKHGYNRLKLRNIRKDIEEKGIKDANGNMTYTRPKSLFKKEKKYQMDANGNITELKKDKVKENKKGNKKTITKENVVRTQNSIVRTKTTTVMKKDDKGNWVVESTKTKEKITPIRESVEGIVNASGHYSQEMLDKYLEGTDGDLRVELQVKLINEIEKKRFTKILDPRKNKFKGAPVTSVDTETGEMITQYRTKSGELLITRSKFRDDGLVETSLTTVNKKGLVTKLETDGVRNKITKRILKEGVDPTSLKSLEDVDENCKKKKGKIGTLNEDGNLVMPDGRVIKTGGDAFDSKTDIFDEKGNVLVHDEKGNVIGYLDKEGNVIGETNEFIENTGYSYNKYYKQQLDRGYIKENEIPDGMFYTTGADGVTRDEYGEEVQYSKDGSKGAFRRFREGYETDSKMTWSDLNIGSWGSSEKAKDNRRLHQGRILKGGNQYDAMQADLDHYFGE